MVKEECPLCLEMGLLRLRTVPDNGSWGGVKPLALHDLVAEGSGIKDTRRVKTPSWQELSQSHSRSRLSRQLTSDFRQEASSWEWKGMMSHRHHATAVVHSVLVSLQLTSVGEALQGPFVWCRTQLSNLVCSCLHQHGLQHSFSNWGLQGAAGSHNTVWLRTFIVCRYIHTQICSVICLFC